jgi:pyruvate-formate lyase
MESFSDDEIKVILEEYKKRRDAGRDYYQRYKDDPEFKKKNQAAALGYYYKNKDKAKNNYEKDKEYNNARNSYYYYKTKGNSDIFESKFPNKYKLLVDRGYINLNNEIPHHQQKMRHPLLHR